MGLRVNLGAGDDIRDGWINLDNRDGYVSSQIDDDRAWRYEGLDGPWRADMRYLDDATQGASIADSSCELVLLNHSLHYVTPSDAELVLDHVVRILEPDGLVVIVEPDVLAVIRDAGLAPWYDKPGEQARFVLALIPDEIEPTDDGKLLRWASWYGERRSLWSWESLADRLTTRGLKVMSDDGDYDHWAEARLLESFVVAAVK